MAVTILESVAGAAPMAPADALATRAPVPAGWDEYRAADGSMVVHAARRLSVLERMRFYKHIPPELQRNPMWTHPALAAACIRRVNGEPVPIPEGEREIEALIRRVGDEVMDRIIAANVARLTAEQAEAEARAKNSQATPSSASA
jgi:hypothetical protein